MSLDIRRLKKESRCDCLCFPTAHHGKRPSIAPHPKRHFCSRFSAPMECVLWLKLPFTLHHARAPQRSRPPELWRGAL